jgi:dihydroxy-acid dehydratase
VLFGYPLDGTVLTIGCDKTTPGMPDGRRDVNLPADRTFGRADAERLAQGRTTGSGTIVWKARELLATGAIDYKGFIKLVASSAPSTGYCNTMGTATTMNS